MATPTIPNGEEYFFPVIYEGNGAGQRVGKFVPFTNNGTIANSVIFNVADNPYLSRTQDTGDSKRKATFSWWFKRGSSLGSEIVIIAAGASSRFLVRFDTSNRLTFRLTNGSTEYTKVTNRSFEDTSKWYHCLWQIDVSQSTATDRSKVWIDGDQVTSWSSDSNPAQNTDVVGLADATTQTIGCLSHSLGTQDWDGYLAEFNYCDNQIVDVSTFGLTDTSTGRWIPKALSGITYGTNGFRLKFQDSSALGDDTSGNTNDFSVNGLTASDQTTDSPTQNFMTFFLEDSAAGTLSEGNLLIDPHTGSGYRTRGTPKTIPQSGKWYMEVKLNVSSGTAYRNHSYGVLDLNQKQIQGLGTSTQFDAQVGGMGIGFNGDRIGFVSLYSTSYDWRLTASSPHSMVNGDFVLMAFDMDNGKAWWGTRDTSGTTTYWYNSSGGTDGNPSTGANPTFTFIPRNHRFMVCQGLYPDSGATLQWYFGSQGFNLTAPTGYGKLSQENFPETAKGISGLVWTKNRDAADSHQLYDSSRGKQLVLTSDTDGQESTVTDGLQKFLAGGQQIEDNVAINTAAESFVTWNWVANGATTSTNTDGSISSTVQANTTAGFSIVQYTGTGSNATVGHGLSSAPEWVMVKLLNQAAVSGFTVGLSADPSGFNNFLYLNENTNSRASSTTWQDTAPTSSVFSIGSSSTVNLSSKNFIAYCWHSVDGFSKFGSYTGNGSADGTFVYTGFKPAWLMVKKTNSTGNWVIMDLARSPINPLGFFFSADSNIAEVTTSTRQTDFLSNGFKLRGANDATNLSGSTYVYMAFAEHPFVGDGTSPVTAR